jgi:hypothetical protein
MGMLFFFKKIWKNKGATKDKDFSCVSFSKTCYLWKIILQKDIMKGHIPSFYFLGVWLQHKEINLVLSIAKILQVLYKTDGEEKWERGLL